MKIVSGIYKEKYGKRSFLKKIYVEIKYDCMEWKLDVLFDT